MTSSYVRNDVTVDSVAVVLSESPRIWKVYYFFRLAEEVWHGGTEALEIVPDKQFDAGILLLADPHGEILYRQGEETFRAVITRIRNDEGYEVTEYGLFGGSSVHRNGWFAEFSWPRKGEDLRGWVSLTVHSPYKLIVNEWENAEYLIRERYTGGLTYIHQTGRWQYPVRSARICRMSSQSYLPQLPFETAEIFSYFFPRPQTAAVPSETEN